jgi:hypothetical protein
VSGCFYPMKGGGFVALVKVGGVADPELCLSVFYCHIPKSLCFLCVFSF